jgi:hypothetical protein
MTDASASGRPARDWLLTSARLLVTIILMLVILAGLGMITAAVCLPLFHERIFAEILEQTGKRVGGDFIVAAELFLAILFLMGFLAFRWLGRLRRVIESVALGDAFAPVNAERLAEMGWLTVGIEALSLPAGAAAHYVTTHLGKSHIDIGLSLGGVLLALVLFILARVFREGAAMRADLEGTV